MMVAVSTANFGRSIVLESQNAFALDLAEPLELSYF